MTKSNLATIDLDLLVTVVGGKKKPVDGWGSEAYSHNNQSSYDWRKVACQLGLLGCTLLGPHEPEPHPEAGPLVGPGNGRPPAAGQPPPKPTIPPIVTIE